MTTRANNEQRRILLVEDQALTRLAVSRLLKNFTSDIICASCGEHAIAHLNRNLFDLCIFDIGLPDIDGLILMKIAKELSPDTPVIIITGGSVDDSMEAEILSDAAYLITKPFEVEYFLECIKEAFHVQEESMDTFFNPFSIPLRGDRKSIRKADRGEINFTCFFTCEEDGVHKMRKKHVQGDTVDRSDEGLAIRIPFPMTANHVIGFNDELNGKFGVVKWQTQINDAAYHCGIKLV